MICCADCCECECVFVCLFAFLFGVGVIALKRTYTCEWWQSDDTCKHSRMTLVGTVG